MLQFPQLFFHLKPETNVILWLKFWRINKQPLLELQSQLKLLGHFAVSLPSHCWCARFGELPAINNIERTRRRARSKKTGWKCPNYFLSEIVAPPYLLRKIKTESTRTLSNFDFQWSKILYQNNLKDIAFFLTFFKG